MPTTCVRKNAPPVALELVQKTVNIAGPRHADAS